MLKQLFSKSRPPERKAATDLVSLSLADHSWFGSSVSAESALTVPAVAAAVAAIADSIGTLRVTVTVPGPDGGRQEVLDHPAAKLLNGDVNSWTSDFEFKSALTRDALMHDVGGIALVTTVNGEPRELIRATPGAVSVVYDPFSGEPSYSASLVSGGQRQLDPALVLHLKAPGPRCPLSLARAAVSVALRQQQHAQALFERGARPSGVLKVPTKLSTDALERLRSAWSGSHGGAENSSRTAILEDGVSWEALTFNSVDLQFVELLKFSVEQIARAFRVPPSMIFHLDRATWSNSEQMGLEFLSYTLQPWLDNWRGAMRRALLTADERAEGFDIAFEADDLSRASLSERAVAYSSLIASRVLCPNEARKWESLPPVEGGNEFINPNISPAAPAPADPPAAPKRRSRTSTKKDATP